MNCRNLIDINLEDILLDEIKTRAFSGTGLKNLRTKLLVYDKTSTEIFSNCLNLMDVQITSNALFEKMFDGCSNCSAMDIIYSNIRNKSETIYNESISTTYEDIPNDIPSIGSTPFSGCRSVQTLNMSGFSDFSLKNILYGLESISSVILDDDAEYSIEDLCFEENLKLSSFTFGRNQTFSSFDDCALSNSNLTSIVLKGIEYKNLPDGQIIYDKYEQYAISNLFNYDLNPQNLKYGVIYTDLSACVEFCNKKKTPLVVFSGKTTNSFDPYRFFNTVKTAELFKKLPYILCWPFSNIKQKYISDQNIGEYCYFVRAKDIKGGKYNFSSYSPFLNRHQQVSETASSYDGKVVYKYESGGDYCIYLFSELLPSNPWTAPYRPFKYVLKIEDSCKDGVGEYVQYDVKLKKLKKIPKTTKYTGAGISQPVGGWPMWQNIILINFNDKTKTELEKYNKSSFVSDSSKRRNIYYNQRIEYSAYFGKLDHDTRVYGSPVLPTKNGINSKYFENVDIHGIRGANVFNIMGPSYLDKLSLWRTLFEFTFDGELIQDILGYVRKVDTSGLEGTIRKESDKKYIKYKSIIENEYGNFIRTYKKHLQKGTKNGTNIKLSQFKFILDTMFKNEKPVSECMTEYTNNPIDLSFQLDLPFETRKFNCWGIGHDCVIQTADGVKCRWDFKRQKLVRL